MSTASAAIVFARLPEPGRVKTRLAGALSDAAACELYAAFLRDVLHLLRGCAAERSRWKSRDPIEAFATGSRPKARAP